MPGTTLSALSAAERHRRVAGGFTGHVAQVVEWDVGTPVEGWTARDVVGHLVTWVPQFLAAGGVDLPPAPGAGDGPAESWRQHAAAVQAVLDDPGRAQQQFADRRTGTMTAAAAIDRFYTPDVFMHTWDLARSTGQPVSLEPEFCAELLAGMEAMEEAIRASGHYGPRVVVPAGASAQDRLIGFIGRDPSWRPDGVVS